MVDRRTEQHSVGIIGLGLMGMAIARRLIEAGRVVTVWNRSPEKSEQAARIGAIVGSSPADVCSRTDVCITMVAGPEALHDVALGPHGVISAGGNAAATFIDMSTVSPADSLPIAHACDKAGIPYLRAPVSGNPGVVAAGNLMIMVSGSSDAFDRVEPDLAQIGPRVVYLGAGEEARVAKLALNLILAGTTQLLGEALALSERAGIDRGDVLAVIGESVLGSRFIGYKSRALIERDFAATFTAAGLHKDLMLATATAHEEGLKLEVTELVKRNLDDCIARGWGGLDFSVLIPRVTGEDAR